ncbi:MAG: hypothetical protein HKN16_09110 [Saprospiraceae bacterium]|nr:hypothetical protein [Saprospiraceae bacterium]
MKKLALILSTALFSLSLMAFAIVKWPVSESNLPNCSKKPIEATQNSCKKEPVNMDLKVGPRFANTISKEGLHQASSINDIIPPSAPLSNPQYNSVLVTKLVQSMEISESGKSHLFTPKQKELILSMDYSNDFYLRGDYTALDPHSGLMKEDYQISYFTIIPEIQASFHEGQEALINLIKDTIRPKLHGVEEGGLRPGRINFVVTEEGNINQVEFESTCGYDLIDEEFSSLLKGMKGKWIPATNAEGEKVSQELVFFYGKMGC